MNKKLPLLLILLAFVSFSQEVQKELTNNRLTPESNRFNIEKDLLLAQFDCKTDVDDLHTVAAFATLMAKTEFSKINYHAVAGTYGIQEGLYVPGNDLFQLAFENNWTDAHENFKAAIEKVKARALKTLDNNGNIWIAEAGQSDFSATLIKAVKKEYPEMNTVKRFNVVQHSKWNEDVTSKASLEYVKRYATYHKIADGNAVGNGTPGFRTPNYEVWNNKLTNLKLLKIWELAVELGIKYNGKEGRYNNEAIGSGGLDFSDLSETCWILDIQDIYDTEEFFKRYAR